MSDFAQGKKKSGDPESRLRVFPRVPSFGLKSLLFSVVLVSACLWFATQYGKVEGRFEIIECDLVASADGHLNGSLQWRYSRVRSDGELEQADTSLPVENLSSVKLSRVKAGDQFVVRFRLDDLGPIKKESATVIFMTEKLGIPKDEILGFIQMDGWSEAIVKSRNPEPKDG